MIVLVVVVCSNMVAFTDYAENKFSVTVKFLKFTVFDSDKIKEKPKRYGLFRQGPYLFLFFRPFVDIYTI